MANAYVLPSLSTAIGISINPISAVDMNALALAQIKNKLENMDKKLDTLLTTEMKVAISNMDDGLFNLEIIENEAYENASKGRGNGAQELTSFNQPKMPNELADRVKRQGS